MGKKIKSLSRIEGLIYISPWLIGFLALQLYPFLASLYYSFTDYAMVGTPNWVGLENFITIFKKDREIWHSLKITLIYVAIAVPQMCIRDSPTRVLDITVSSTLGTTSRNVFFIKCPMLYTPPPDFQP